MVVEPAGLIAEAAVPDVGRRSLYVALTRAPQQLTVVTTDPSVLTGGAPADPVAEPEMPGQQGPF